jgi:hypothetical protein
VDLRLTNTINKTKQNIRISTKKSEGKSLPVSSSSNAVTSTARTKGFRFWKAGEAVGSWRYQRAIDYYDYYQGFGSKSRQVSFAAGHSQREELFAVIKRLQFKVSSLLTWLA